LKKETSTKSTEDSGIAPKDVIKRRERPISRKNTLGLQIKTNTSQKLLGEINMRDNNMDVLLNIGKGNEISSQKEAELVDNKEDVGKISQSMEKNEEKEKDEQEEQSTIKSLFSNVRSFFS